jgi:large subunit ribosomal protein L6
LSRIGKSPVKLPDGVEVKVAENVVSVKGLKGTLTQSVSQDFKVAVNVKEKIVTVAPVSDNKNVWAKWGLYRVLINNMVKGVTEGYQKILEIEGIGYKAEMKGQNLMLLVGFSHPAMYIPPSGIKFTTEGPAKIIINGIDKQLVGQVAAEIRNIRPPEPYKSKGIRYQGEHIKRKAGKTGTK